MVLTRSMATTNDIQEEEPPTTALEKQVRTLAAAVERLTKQNHDLEEQLHQKDAAPGPVAKLYGCFLRIQPDPDARGRSRENLVRN